MRHVIFSLPLVRLCACIGVLSLGLGLTAQTKRRHSTAASSSKASSTKPTSSKPAPATTDNAVPQKPNFTGEWSMESEKSHFGAFPTPTTLTLKISDKAPDLLIDTTQRGTSGEHTAHTEYRTDGGNTVNQLSSGVGTSHTFWDGNTLVIRTTLKTRKDVDVLMEERWELSKDKKELTVKSHIETSKGGADLTLVCSRTK